MNSVSQMLTELSIDPFRLEDFLRDPAPLVGAAGITPEGLPRLMFPSKSLPDETWERCASCTDPGYDPLPDPDVPTPSSTHRT